MHQHPSSSIILIGMPGAGKSYWAQQWAQVSGRKAVDLDTEIERATGQTVPEIFDQRGESGFRKIESEMLRHILAIETGIILATGGGTPCFENNLGVMLGAGKVIYLEAPIELLVQRILQTPSARPLLHPLSGKELSEKLRHMLREREVFYRQAHHTVSVSALSPATFAAL